MINSEKKPAAENPWYVLATLVEDELLCASYWNAWVRQVMSDEESFDMKYSKLRKEAEELFKERLPNATLPNPHKSVDFSNVKFSHNINFRGFLFPEMTNFEGAIFSGDVEFSFTKFAGTTIFDGAIFSGNANFGRTVFSGDTNFIEITFSGDAGFLRTVFSGDAIFTAATFSGNANFERTVFSGTSDFFGTKFHKKVFFDNATFNEPCDFRYARFIKAYPILSGTQLHSKTTVTAEDEHWPTTLIKQSNDDNKDILEACIYLRKNMTSQGLTDAAHFFFSREMDHKAKLSRWWERPFYKAYS